MEDAFDGQMTDSLARNNGRLIYPSNTVSGPPDCGRALEGEEDTVGMHAVLDPSPDWALASGSIDFFVLLREPPGPPFDEETTSTKFILTRDSRGLGAGHLSIGYDSGGRLLLNLETGNNEIVLCTEPNLPQDVWHHVGVNFGPPGVELYLNGVAKREAGISTLVYAEPCWTFEDSPTVGLDGNTNAWTILASNWPSPPGTAQNVWRFFDGRLDQLRFSSIRRDFRSFNVFGE